MDVDERADHPANWDWTTLLDLPDSGGVEVLAAVPIDNMTLDEVESVVAGFRLSK